MSRWRYPFVCIGVHSWWHSGRWPRCGVRREERARCPRSQGGANGRKEAQEAQEDSPPLCAFCAFFAAKTNHAPVQAGEAARRDSGQPQRTQRAQRACRSRRRPGPHGNQTLCALCVLCGQAPGEERGNGPNGLGTYGRSRAESAARGARSGRDARGPRGQTAALQSARPRNVQPAAASGIAHSPVHALSPERWAGHPVQGESRRLFRRRPMAACRGREYRSNRLRRHEVPLWLGV